MIGLLALTVLLQLEGRDPATFARRVAELEVASGQRSAAVSPDDRARTTLAWLGTLQRVLEAVPVERAAGPHLAWTKANEELIFYDEIGGRWLIRHETLLRLHEDHAKSAVADQIAWLAVTNGLGGECEGSVACYARGLNRLYGDYLRARPRGSYRREAFESIARSLRVVVDDLLTSPLHSTFLDPEKECDYLLRSMRPLRDAVAAAGGAKTETMTLIDRVIAQCPAERNQ